MSSTTIRECTIESIARILSERRKSGRPPVLLVGAGISMQSGGPSGTGLMEYVLRDHPPSDQDWEEATQDFSFPADVKPKVRDYLESRLNNKITDQLNKTYFNSINIDIEDVYAKVVTSMYGYFVSRRSLQELYGIFHEYIQYNNPTFGYEHLSILAKRGYFDWIISTNFDPLLEESLSNARVPQHDFIVFSRILSQPDQVATFIDNDYVIPKIKIFKIHGDLKHRQIDATLESVQKFRPEEDSMRQSLVDLIQRRDLVVIGHSLNDPNIIGLIRDAAQKCKERECRSNSIWLLTMPKHEAATNKNIIDISAKYKSEKGSGFNCITKNNSEIDKILKEKGNPESDRDKHTNYFFGDCMSSIYNHLIKIENGTNDAKSIHDFEKIYYTCGMTPNKKQLMNLIVAPSHIDADDWLNSDACMDETDDNKKNDFSNRVSPIYLAHPSDSMIVNLLGLGLEQNRSNTKITTVISDFPALQMPFVRSVYLRVNPAIDATGTKEILSASPQKGTRVLSQALFTLSKAKKPDAPLTIGIDGRLSPNEAEFLKRQNYSQMGQEDSGYAAQMLRSLCILAGNSSKIAIQTETTTDADITLSLKLGEDEGTLPGNVIEIPIFRFIPVFTTDSAIRKKMKTARSEGALFLTVGGPEHNKILETFIALHRWGGGKTAMIHSNWFDRDEIDSASSAVVLYNESYVGGVMKQIKGGQNESVERNRTGDGAFLVNFTVPLRVLDLIDGKTPKSGRDAISGDSVQVLAIIGQSARGTINGLNLVAFNPKYKFGQDKPDLLDVPTTEPSPTLPQDQVFAACYALALHGKMPLEWWGDTLKGAGLEKAYPSDHAERLRVRADEPFLKWMKDSNVQFDEIGPGNNHAKLWSLVAQRYLLRNP